VRIRVPDRQHQLRIGDLSLEYSKKISLLADRVDKIGREVKALKLSQDEEVVRTLAS